MELHQLMEGGEVITSTARPIVAKQQGGRKKRESPIGVPYNPDDERFARLLDSLWRAGRMAGWNECFMHHKLS